MLKYVEVYTICFNNGFVFLILVDCFFILHFKYWTIDKQWSPSVSHKSDTENNIIFIVYMLKKLVKYKKN